MSGATVNKRDTRQPCMRVIPKHENRLHRPAKQIGGRKLPTRPWGSGARRLGVSHRTATHRKEHAGKMVGPDVLHERAGGGHHFAPFRVRAGFLPGALPIRLPSARYRDGHISRGWRSRKSAMIRSHRSDTRDCNVSDIAWVVTSAARAREASEPPAFRISDLISSWCQSIAVSNIKMMLSGLVKHQLRCQHQKRCWREVYA